MPQNPSPNRSDDEHPFLTPKGLRLLRGNKENAPSPIDFPEYPLIAESFDGDRDSNDKVDPFDFERGLDQPLFNIKVSAKFPDPDVLGSKPLTSHYQSQRVKQPQDSDLKAIGKLFIQLSRNPRHELAMGSAWITGSNTIATAAHNLFDSNTRAWSKALEFHPGYNFYATKGLPTCRVTSCLVPKGYFDNPTTNRDIATCFVDKKIGDIVGAKIPMKPIPGSDYFDRTKIAIVGYPAGSGFDFGKQMWQSVGDYLFGHSNGPGDDFAPVVATDFGGGASGCPWIAKDPETRKYHAIGVTSGHAKLRYLRGEPNLASLTSPYFGHRMFRSLGDNAVFHDFG
jgi:V8-like Glu-specific endopeptidase